MISVPSAVKVPGAEAEGTVGDSAAVSATKKIVSVANQAPGNGGGVGSDKRNARHDLTVGRAW